MGGRRLREGVPREEFGHRVGWPEVAHLGAEAFQQGDQHHPFGIVDGPLRQGASRLGQFIAR